MGREWEKKMSDIHGRGVWKRKRKKILKRDKNLCCDCKRYGKRTAAVVVHHMIPYEEAPELGLVDSNLISLCEACHNKRHPEKGTKAGRKRRAPHPEGVKN